VAGSPAAAGAAHVLPPEVFAVAALEAKVPNQLPPWGMRDAVRVCCRG